MRWYIIGGIAVFLIGGWFLTRGSDSMMGAGTDIDRNADGSTTYTNDEGSVTVGTSARMPTNWPSDAPDNVAGAVIVYSGTSNPQTGQTGSAVSYTVRTSVQSVVDHYRSALASGGWTVNATANTGGATVISATKDTRTFGAYIVDTGDGNVTVTAGIEL
jgi:hypothetical protein